MKCMYPPPNLKHYLFLTSQIIHDPQLQDILISFCNAFWRVVPLVPTLPCVGWVLGVCIALQASSHLRINHSISTVLVWHCICNLEIRL